MNAPLSTLPLFAPRSPEPERQAAVSVLDRMAGDNRAWLARIRLALAELCAERVGRWGEADPRAYVCADDADRLTKTRADMAMPAGASPNLMGTVFRGSDWLALDRTHVSSQPGSHGNILTRWRYVGPRRSAA